MAKITINDITLGDIEEFIDTGDIKKAPDYVVEYLLLMEKIYGMIRRIDIYGNDESIIKHLRLTQNLSDYKARKMLNETREYFYANNKLTKDAWRGIYGEIADQMINFARQEVRTPADAKMVVDMAVKTAKEIRGVNEPEKEELPEEMFKAPFVVYTMNPEDLGLPKANRTKLAQIIDEYPDLTEKEKARIKSEAQALPLKVFPDEQEDPRKS